MKNKQTEIQQTEKTTKEYDYLIVGAGLFGSIFAYEANKKGKKCLVIDKRDHIGGNIYTYEQNGITVHKYGAHIFHTNDKEVENYIKQFATFNRFTNSPLASINGKLFNLPFNMNTFHQIWGIQKPEEAKQIIEKQIQEAGITDPKNLEEKAISLVGKDVYELLIKGYTEKQWGRKATDLPASIIRRIPVRFIYDNNYFNDDFQGIPKGGYTPIIEKMLEGIEVKLNTDYQQFKENNKENKQTKVVYTGPIDQYFDYCYGNLDYRGLTFEFETLPIGNYQGNAVVNYTSADVPYTRIIEHKHFEFAKGDPNTTIITKEYPNEWKLGMEPYYPINDDKNTALLNKYLEKAKQEPNTIFGGRLGLYRYLDMQDVIRLALDCVKREL